jgi:signal peptidase II
MHMGFQSRTKTLSLFGGIVIVWFIFDRVVKMACDTVRPGTVLIPHVLGLFDFQLVHNTGAAWGMFGGSTAPLGVFSLLVCAGIAAYVFAYRKGRCSVLETVALSLVFAGGLGNAIDRLAMGYVVDFINCTFIDFPVFNIADIGVTCGVALFLLALLLESRKGEPLLDDPDNPMPGKTDSQ